MENTMENTIKKPNKRLKKWYNKGGMAIMRKKSLFSLLICLKLIKIKVPNFVLIKILDYNMPLKFSYIGDNYRNCYDYWGTDNELHDDPINKFICSLIPHLTKIPKTVFIDELNIYLILSKKCFVEVVYNSKIDYNKEQIELKSICYFKNWDFYYEDVEINIIIRSDKLNKNFIIKDKINKVQYTIEHSHPQYEQMKKLCILLINEFKNQKIRKLEYVIRQLENMKSNCCK